MKPEQQRAILKAAAKACGFKKWRELTGGLFQFSTNENWNEAFAEWTYWNPIDTSRDTATMCAKLDIDTIWTDRAVICADDSREREQEVRHDGTTEGKVAAWRLAASMVAAKVGGYTDE